MQFKKIYMYIGSNNTTHILEKEKAEAIVGKYFDGFTAFEVVGYWRGNKEKTLKIEIVAEVDSAVIVRVAKELKKELEQDSIMVEVLESNAVFI